MKKVLCLLLMATLLFSMCACSSVNHIEKEISEYLADWDFVSVQNTLEGLDDSQKEEVEITICEGLGKFITENMPSESMYDNLKAACDMMEYYGVDKSSSYWDAFQLYKGWKEYYVSDIEWCDYLEIHDEYSNEVTSRYTEFTNYYADSSLSGMTDSASSFELLYNEIYSKYGDAERKGKEYLAAIEDLKIGMEGLCNAVKNKSSSNFQSSKEKLLDALDRERNLNTERIGVVEEKIAFMDSELYLKYYGEMIND